MKIKFFSILLSLIVLSACEGAFDVEGDYDIESADRGEETTGDDDTEDTTVQTPADSPADTITTQAALTGQEIYVDTCGTCHGDDGKGAQAWPVSIEGYFPVYGVIKDGQGDMSSIPLSDEDIGKIQTFLLEMDM